VLLEGASYHVGFGETWSDLTIADGAGHSGTIAASSGAAITADNIAVAKTSGSQGELRVTGPGTTLEVETQVTLGEAFGSVPSAAHGLLVVEDQAVATMAELQVGLLGRGEVIVDNATLNVPENTSNNDSGEIRVGGKAASTFTVRNGGVVNTAFFDLSNPDSDTTTATVTGPDSQLHASRGIAVGESKEGKFHVLDGAQVTTRVLSTGNGNFLAAGKLNEIIIDGQQTQVDVDLFLNATARGSARISGGAQVTANSAEAFGGSLLVRGSGTLLDVSTTTSQAYSLGVTNNQLIIEQGAEVRSQGLGIGYTVNTQSTAIVRGSDSRLESTGLLFLVGALSPGALEILDGGVVERTGDAVIGASNVAHAAVDVAGAGSQFNVDGNLYLSGGHIGGQTYSFPDVLSELNITDDARVNVTGTLEPFNQGEVNLQSGSLTATEITLASGGSFHFTGGRLSTESFLGDLVQQGGTLAPGQSPGVTQVSGSYQQDAGALEIELMAGGTNPTAGVDFDQLIADSIVLGGDLQIVLGAGYQPVLGDEFLIASASTSLSGTFDQVLSQQLAGDLAWDVLIDPLARQVVLSVVTAGIEGDFDQDDDVDGADFLRWQRGGSSDPLSGSDLAAWRANYGSGSAAATNTTAVPEPGTWLLLATALAWLTAVRGKRRVGKGAAHYSPSTASSFS
jgi:T5SS/PEP-CTERM-associated repeat protein